MTLRREQKLTQRQLAEKSGIPKSEISRIETGDANPTFATLSALAEPFGVCIGFIPPDAA
jgi:transcriptional regulator with XRE-family HTH domain